MANQTFLYKENKSSDFKNININLNYSNTYDVSLTLFSDVYEDSIVDNLNITLNCYNSLFVDIITSSNSSCVFTNNILNIYNYDSIKIEEKEYGSDSINYQIDVYYNNELYYQK